MLTDGAVRQLSGREFQSLGAATEKRRAAMSMLCGGDGKKTVMMMMMMMIKDFSKFFLSVFVLSRDFWIAAFLRISHFGRIIRIPLPLFIRVYMRGVPVYSFERRLFVAEKIIENGEGRRHSCTEQCRILSTVSLWAMNTV